MKRKFSVAFLVVLLFVSVLITACDSEKLRYDVNSVRFLEGNGEIFLSHSEINELFDRFSSMEFSDEKLTDERPDTMIGSGGMLIIDTDSEIYYLVCDNTMVALWPDEDYTLANRIKCITYDFNDDPEYAEAYKMIKHWGEKVRGW